MTDKAAPSSNSDVDVFYSHRLLKSQDIATQKNFAKQIRNFYELIDNIPADTFLKSIEWNMRFLSMDSNIDDDLPIESLKELSVEGLFYREFFDLILTDDCEDDVLANIFIFESKE